MRYDHEDAYYECNDSTEYDYRFVCEGLDDIFACFLIYEQTETGDGHVEAERFCEEE